MKIVENQISNYKISKSLENLEKYYTRPSFLELLGVERKEVVHTKFLAWLFDLPEDINNNSPIQLFLNYFISENIKQFRSQEFNLFDQISDTKIHNEKGSKNRFDLIIEFKNNGIKTKIIVENKVHSGEHNEQTTRYAKHKEKDTEMFFAYLTPTTNNKLVRENFSEINENFVLLNYQGILDEVLTKLKYEDDKVNIFLNEYILTLSKSWTLHLKNKNQYNAMAFTNEQRELLNEFWQDNSNLILLAMQSISEDNSYSDEVKTEVANALDSLKKIENNRGLKFYLESKDSRSEEFHINDIVRQVLEFTKENEQVFDSLLHNNKFNSFPLVVKKNSKDYEKHSSRYGKKDAFIYKKPGDRNAYACLRNWDVNNVVPFRDYIEKEFDIKLKKVI